jgi:hypothetical protein
MIWGVVKIKVFPKFKKKIVYSQKKRRENPHEAKGQDYDHKRQTFVSVKSNRGNEGQGTRKESGNNYSTKT